MQRLSRTYNPTPSPSASNTKPKKTKRIIDCGAGIGRITSDLLVDIAHVVDIVEPNATFAQTMIDSDLKREGQVGNVWIQGLEQFTVPPGVKYNIMWNQ
ncbi:hypothetical protein H2198_010488 [Neophaeococcomyces mojaviensis]|uniref:Uncharacterized protein n=1 Tax=Neophaeococcomyces mojaviensis TaxID=3383035 RepID=A0ACC2ZRF6_9EURO|nr:hypothetical protein H2198_010488 [Knufia sp. JES_112]